MNEKLEKEEQPSKISVENNMKNLNKSKLSTIDEKQIIQDQIQKSERKKEDQQKLAIELKKKKEKEETLLKHEQERKQRKEMEEKRLALWEKQRQEEKEAKRKREEAKELSRKAAEEIRQKELEDEEAGRRAREMQRKQALEELHRVRRRSQILKTELENKEEEDKENVPKSSLDNPADVVQKIATEENKRLSSYAAVKSQDDVDSLHVKEAESIAAAGRKAREEAVTIAKRIESSVAADKTNESTAASAKKSSVAADDQGAIYYGAGSAARRSSKDVGRDSCVINEDLADEVEAIRLAADFSSRRLLQEQRKESGATGASTSRLRIRALLDKQKNQREEEDKIRKEKRESQDVSKFLWVYR